MPCPAPGPAGMARNRIIGTLALALVLGLLIGARDHEYDDWLVPIYTVLDRDMFPASWEDHPREVIAYPLESDDLPQREMQLIDRTLSQFTPALLGEVECIYLASRIQCEKHHLQVLSSSDRMYLALGNASSSRSRRALEGDVYWGMGSILYHRFQYRLDTRAWEHLLPRDFEYVGSGCQAIHEGKHSHSWQTHYHERGFLYQYTQASMACDFISIARELFRDNARFWRVIEEHPRLRAKTDLVIDFFHSLDPIYDEDFFRNEHGERRERLAEFHPQYHDESHGR